MTDFIRVTQPNIIPNSLYAMSRESRTHTEHNKFATVNPESRAKKEIEWKTHETNNNNNENNEIMQILLYSLVSYG